MVSSSFRIQPFSILRPNSQSWRARRKEWESEGVIDTSGREDALSHYFQPLSSSCDEEYLSVFDPVLAECAYRWFCKDGGDVLDPFCGGATRGFVAASLGMGYTGVDIRQKQIDANIVQCKKLVNTPIYICADSYDKVCELGMFDLIFSCPPYYNLEVYSNDPCDLSNMPTYNDFLKKYKMIIKECCNHLRIGGFAVFVVGEIRDDRGYCRGFVNDTINAFRDSGMRLWNEIIIDQPNQGAFARLGMFNKTRKTVKIHQNMLVFAKDVNEKGKIERQIGRFVGRNAADKERLMKAYAMMKK